MQIRITLLLPFPNNYIISKMFHVLVILDLDTKKITPSSCQHTRRSFNVNYKQYVAAIHYRSKSS